MKLQFEIVGNKADVFRFLADADAFVSVHPLIYKAKLIQKSEYLIYEAIKLLGVFPYKFTYKAEILADTEKGKVEMRATVRKQAKIFFAFHVRQIDNEKVEIIENLEIVANVLIKKYLQKLIKKQHAKLFSNIQTALSVV